MLGKFRSGSSGEFGSVEGVEENGDKLDMELILEHELVRRSGRQHNITIFISFNDIFNTFFFYLDKNLTDQVSGRYYNPTSHLSHLIPVIDTNAVPKLKEIFDLAIHISI